MPRLTGTLMVLLLLSGCFGSSDEEPGEPAQGDETVNPDLRLDISAPPPEWALGLSWKYAVEIPGLPTSRFVMGVAEDQGNLWIVATENRTKALHHALYSTNPVLGRITKTGLSPYQSGEPVEMFRFPLTDRLTWTGTFFDESMTFEAVYDDAVLTLPNVYLPGFRLQATAASGAKVVYNYVEAVQWFTDFQYYNASGAKQIHLSLEDYGDPFRGAFHFLRGKDLLVDSFRASTDATAPPTFDVTADDGFGKVAVGIVAEGQGDTSAVVNLTLKDPAGTVRLSKNYILPDQELATHMEEIPVAEGTWTVEVVLVGTASLEARFVGLRITEGTL